MRTFSQTCISLARLKYHRYRSGDNDLRVDQSGIVEFIYDVTPMRVENRVDFYFKEFVSGARK